MARKKKNQSKNTGQMSDDLMELIRVTPEQTQEFYERTVPYTIHEKPLGKKVKGKLYCPYCDDFYKFVNKKDSDGSYKRCSSCNISENDFHVKNANHLWGTLKKK